MSAANGVYQPKPEHKFSFGLWTLGNRGRDPFGDFVRPTMPPNEIAAVVGEIGAWGVNLHDNDLVPIDARAAERDRILREFRRPPDRQRDGTATWSLSTLQRALRRAPDGLPHVSTFTLLAVLWDAGYTWQRERTWCPTGTARRKRRDGTVVTLTDPRATPKKR